MCRSDQLPALSGSEKSVTPNTPTRHRIGVGAFCLGFHWAHEGVLPTYKRVEVSGRCRRLLKRWSLGRFGTLNPKP